MTWWQILLQVLTIILGSVGLFSFIEFLIRRKDERNVLLKEVLAQQKKNEKDNCRTQMLLLMSAYPQDIHELMVIAEHYFKDLHGNWYMTSLFKAFLKKRDIAFPEWIPESITTNEKE